MTNGEVFGGRYEIKEFIGEGGMAMVYRAVDKRTLHSVAVKILKPEYNSDKEFLGRFQREAQAASRMNHHNIVNLLDVGIEGSNRYLVLEYVNGVTLKDIIRKKGRLEVPKSIQFAVRILSALQHAHERGIVHRDIKPQNILVDANGYVKVADFGIARISNVGTVSTGDTVIGSVHYASPEQAQGGDVRATSDIYSTGVVLYEMLTGRVPFQGDTPVAVAMQHVNSVPPPITSFARNVPPELVAVVRKAMEKNPANRYQTAREMAEALVLVRDGKLKPASGADEPNAPADAAVLMPESPLPVMDRPTISYAPHRHARRHPPKKPDLSALDVEDLPDAQENDPNAPGDPNEPNMPHASRTSRTPYSTHTSRTSRTSRSARSSRSAKEARQLNASAPRRITSKSRRFTRIAATAIVSVFVFSILVFGGMNVYDRVVNMTYAPDVEGLDEASATRLIKRAGLIEKVVPVSHMSIAAGYVILQTPDFDTEMRKGDTLVINVSSGPPLQIVPKVTGIPQEDALAALTSIGLVMAVAGKGVSDEPIGTVLTQNPADGLTCKKGDTVQVTISGGRTVLPSVEKMLGSDAQALLADAGFAAVSIETKDVEEETEDGLVLSQIPAGDTPVVLDAQVTLTVGKYHPPFRAKVELDVPVTQESFRIRVALVHHSADGSEYEVDAYSVIYVNNESDTEKPVVELLSRESGTFVYRVYIDEVFTYEKEVTFDVGTAGAEGAAD